MAAARDRRGLVASIDWWIIAIFLALLALGWVSVCGASYDPEAEAGFFSLSTRSGMQIVWIASSIVLAALILCIDENIYDAFSYLAYVLFLLLLFITPFFAHEIKGSLSWIKVGKYSIQPAEFAKFATALCLAKLASRHGFNLEKWGNLILSWIVVLLPMGLIVMQKETGCALVYIAFFIALYREGMPGAILLAGLSAIAYFIIGVRYADTPLFGIEQCHAGTFLVLSLALAITLFMSKAYAGREGFPLWKLLGAEALAATASLLVARFVAPFNASLVMLALVGALTLYLLVRAFSARAPRYALAALFALCSAGFHFSCDKLMDDVLEAHQQTRIRVLLGMEDDPRGAGYNVIQAKIAIGSGGLKGKGFLNGTQTKLRYVPEQDTDFIFCTVGEEEGFAGCAIVLFLFLALILRIIALAERQPDTMGRVYGYCVASVLLFHVFINVGMVLGLAPVIGIPLPFFSYGGSSLWGFTALLFIFLRMDAAHKKLRQR